MVRRWGWVPMALVAVAVLLAPRAPAGADTPTAHGYWWRLQSGVGPHLTPPGVPEGGLWVTADPSGDQAVAALRISPAAGARAAAMRLRVAEVTGSPSIVACPAASAWEPAEAGSWDARPDAACADVAVDAVFDDGTLTVALAAFGDGAVDVVLVPDAESAGYFSVAFAPPDGDTFTVAGSAVATTTPVTRPASAPVPTVAARPAPVTYEPPPASFSAPPFAPPPDPVSPVVSVVPSTAATEPARAATGTREPFAAVALLVVAAGWAYRGRAALRGAASHPLATANVAFSRAEP